MERTKVVITLEGGLIAVYSDFPNNISVEVIDLDEEDACEKREICDHISQLLERVY